MLKKIRLVCCLSAIIALLYSPVLAQKGEIVIRNAKILDGTGNPWYYGDIVITGGKISEIVFPESISVARFASSSRLLIVTFPSALTLKADGAQRSAAFVCYVTFLDSTALEKISAARIT